MRIKSQSSSRKTWGLFLISIYYAKIIGLFLTVTQTLLHCSHVSESIWSNHEFISILGQGKWAPPTHQLFQGIETLQWHPLHSSYALQKGFTPLSGEAMTYRSRDIHSFFFLNMENSDPLSDTWSYFLPRGGIFCHIQYKKNQHVHDRPIYFFPSSTCRNFTGEASWSSDNAFRNLQNNTMELLLTQWHEHLKWDQQKDSVWKVIQQFWVALFEKHQTLTSKEQ